jgi:hypothetical protein
MKDTDFNKLLKFKVINGLMYPDNAQATEYILSKCKPGSLYGGTNSKRFIFSCLLLPFYGLVMG